MAFFHGNHIIHKVQEPFSVLLTFLLELRKRNGYRREYIFIIIEMR